MSVVFIPFQGCIDVDAGAAVLLPDVAAPLRPGGAAPVVLELKPKCGFTPRTACVREVRV